MFSLYRCIWEPFAFKAGCQNVQKLINSPQLFCLGPRLDSKYDRGSYPRGHCAPDCPGFLLPSEEGSMWQLDLPSCCESWKSWGRLLLTNDDVSNVYRKLDYRSSVSLPSNWIPPEYWWLTLSMDIITYAKIIYFCRQRCSTCIGNKHWFLLSSELIIDLNDIWRCR